MTILFGPQYFTKSILILFFIAAMSACGGGGGKSQSTPTSQAGVSSAVSSSLVSSSITSSASSLVSTSSSHSSINSSTISSSSSSSTTAYLMGGAIQGNPLKIATVVSTLVGTPPGMNGTGSAARFYWPSGIVHVGVNLFVVDSGNSTIRKIVIATGEVTIFAGAVGVQGNTDGIGKLALFNQPTGITTDGTNLFVADTQNNVIRKIIISTAEVTTLAGKAGESGRDDGIGSSARFDYPTGITTDGTNLFVADTSNEVIRKIVIATATVTKLVGTFGARGSVDGAGDDAEFDWPQGIVINGANLYVTDAFNNTIRKVVIATGVVTTFAGSTSVSGSSDGIGANAKFALPVGVTADGVNLYITDTGNSTVRKIVIATAEVTTIAGTPEVSGSSDGTGTSAGFDSPNGIVVDGGSLYVTDAGNNTIRKVAITSGIVTTLAGKAVVGGGDGIGGNVSLLGPYGITSDGVNLYSTDAGGSTIRKTSIATGVVTTIAGAKGERGSANGVGIEATFNEPYGITTEGVNLYIADSHNHTIRKVVIATGVVTTLAGTPNAKGSADGKGAAARFSYPNGITTDGSNLYVADTDNHTIRKIIIATGEVTTLAGAFGIAGHVDGTGAGARFDRPFDITTDGNNLFVTDTDNHTIRKIVLATGVVTTLVGSVDGAGSADGVGASASFYYPQAITSDGTNLYVADTGNQTIRKVVIATGLVTTLVGTAGVLGNSDGAGASASFRYPQGITTDGFDLFVTDLDNSTIRKIH